MDVPDDLLTLSEVVGRLQAASFYKNDHSRRSGLNQLFRRGDLTDYLTLEPSRTRASKYDRRISAAELELFLASRTRSADPPSTTTRQEAHGLTAVQELIARVDILMQDRAADRETAMRVSRAHENELHGLRQRVLDLEHQARLAEIDDFTARDQLRDEAATRQTYENVITQLVAPNDLGDVLRQR